MLPVSCGALMIPSLPELLEVKWVISVYILPDRGPGSSVDIATDYELEGPGSNPSGDKVLRPSRPALGPT